jgi:hypothetical protein
MAPSRGGYELVPTGWSTETFELLPATESARQHDLAMVMGSRSSTIQSVVRFGRILGFGGR